MRELRIEEQKSICGGTQWYFEDLTTHRFHYSEDFQTLKNKQTTLISQGHTVTGIKETIM